MRIGISGHWLSSSGGGIYRYTKNLVDRLSEEHEVYVINGSHRKANEITYDTQDARTLPGKTIEQIKNVDQINQYDLDVIHCPGEMVHPYFWNVDAPKIITFNGDEPVSEFGLRKRLHILGSMFSVRYLSSLASIYLLKRRVDEFVVVSSLMRENIACGYGINESKINVIHHGIDTNAFSEVTGEQLRDSLREVGVSRPYILHVSGFRPVKNTQRILEAYDRANLPTDTSLVFAGKKINEYEDVRRMVTRKNINGVCFAGFVDENLQALYSGAEVLCQPSYRETFGFPVLESLACGTPVITSRKIGSLEGYPDSQVQIDPESVSEIRRALEQVVPDKTCQQELVDAGRPILRERTWDKTVEKTLAVYREAIQ